VLGEWLEETFSKKIAVRDQKLELFDNSVMEFDRLVEDTDVILEGKSVEAVTRWASAGTIFLPEMGQDLLVAARDRVICRGEFLNRSHLAHVQH
jgi:hypothetical protein